MSDSTIARKHTQEQRSLRVLIISGFSFLIWFAYNARSCEQNSVSEREATRRECLATYMPHECSDL